MVVNLDFEMKNIEKIIKSNASENLEAAVEIIFEKVVKKMISNTPRYHDTRGCNWKYFHELF